MTDQPDSAEAAAEVFIEAATAEATRVAKDAAKKAELKLLADLRARLQGDAEVKRFARFEDYAKWLFGLTAVVTAAASSISLSGASPATGLGRQVFALAQIFAVAGLVLAGAALIPRLNPYNPNNVQSMQEALNRFKRSLRTKGIFVLAAGVAFTIALVAAGLSPVLVRVPPVGWGANVALVRNVDDKGGSTVQVQLSETLPRLPATLQLGQPSAAGTCTDPSDLEDVATGQTDVKGGVSLQATLGPDAGVTCLVASWGSAGNDGSGADAGRRRWTFGPTLVGTQWTVDYGVDAKNQLTVAVAGHGLAPGEQVLMVLGRGTSASCEPDPALGGLDSVSSDLAGDVKLQLASTWSTGLCVVAEESPTASPRTDTMNHRWTLTAGN